MKSPEASNPVIDFSPLEAAVSREQQKTVKEGKYIHWLYIVAGLSIVIFIALSAWMNTIFFPPLLVTVGTVIATIFLSERAKTIVRLRTFAEKNHLRYSSGAPYDERDGLLFQVGHSKKFLDVLAFSDHGVAEIGNFQYTTGSGKNSHTYKKGFLRLELPRRLPHVVLDAKSNNFLGKFSNLSSAYKGSQRLSLEGDFDKYFTLYAPDSHKRDALYVFTPDVMQAMIDAAHEYDAEIIDNNLYLYSGSSLQLHDSATLKELLTIADKIRAELIHQVDYYADERVANRASDTISDSGRRLRQMSLKWVGIVVLVVVGFQILSFFIEVFSTFNR